MYRIDDLITEIHNNEAIEIPGEMTGEQKKRVEAYIQAMISEEEIVQSDFSVKRRRFPRKRKSVVFLAAALVLMLGLTVFAAKQNEWDITLIQFMGLNESHVLQLEGGEVVIDKTTTTTWKDYARNPEGEESRISITGITSIGDKNSAYLKVNTDYELPEEFDETTDYILPENHSVDIRYRNKFGREEFRTFGSTFTAFYEGGKLGFLVSIENCEELNRCNVKLKIENLYWYHDLGQHEETEDTEPEELLAAGKWETQWRYSYKSNVKTVHKVKRFDTEEGVVFLTKIEISPISIRMEVIRNPIYHDLPWTTELLEEIQYEDGSRLKVDQYSVGGLLNGIFIEEFINADYLGDVLRPEEIKSIKVCGQDIDI